MFFTRYYTRYNYEIFDLSSTSYFNTNSYHRIKCVNYCQVILAARNETVVVTGYKLTKSDQEEPLSNQALQTDK